MAKKKINWVHKRVPIDQVRPNPKNPRIFRDDEMKELGESIDRFGQAEPLTANADGMLIGGHARLEILTQRGEKEVDVFFASEQIPEKLADELMLRLNRNIAGTFDMDAVYTMFKPEELIEIGFKDYELDLGHLVDTEQHGFRRPEFTEPGVPKQGNLSCYFYIEYYGDEEGFQAIKEKLGEAMLTDHEIDPDAFKKLILDGEE